MARLLHTAMLALGALSAAGCGGLALERSLQETDRAWPAFGMNAGRTGFAAEPLRPPLRFAWAQDIGGGSGPGSPVVMDSVVLLSTMRGDLYAIHAGTGKTLGWVNLGEAIHGSPAVERFIAYVALANTPAGSLVAYDYYDGAVRWKRPYGDIEVTPLLARGRLYFGNLAGMFFAVETVEGNEHWRFTLPDNTRLKGIRSTPAFDGGAVVFGADDGALYALDADDGTLRWRVDAGAPVWATPAVAEGTVVAGTIEGAVLGIDLASGAVGWRYNAGAPVYAGALLVGGRALVVTLAGTIHCLETGTGRSVWTTDAGGPLNASPVAAAGVAYLGTLRREMLAVDVASGEILWRETVEGRIKSAAALAQGRLFVATDERELLAFEEALR